MKLLVRFLCVCTIALLVVGLILQLSVGSLSGPSALARENLVSGIVDLSGKVAIIGAFTAAFLGAQREQWRWIAALVVCALITLFSGPLGDLTHTGIVLYIISPIATAAITMTYTYHMRAVAPARV